MSFSAHKNQMVRFYEYVDALEQKNPTEQHLCALLDFICTHGELFDAAISAHSPFYTEFFSHICAESVDAENCFALLECLIVFCRERQLSAQAEEISLAEKELLQYFEQSHHWHKDEPTLIREWYWHTLPQKYGHLMTA